MTVDGVVGGGLTITWNPYPGASRYIITWTPEFGTLPEGYEATTGTSARIYLSDRITYTVQLVAMDGNRQVAFHGIYIHND